MHIVVNATFHLKGAGSLGHLQNLLKAWADADVYRDHEVSLFVRAENVGLFDGSVREQIDLQPIGGRYFNSITKLGWEQFVLPRIAKDRGAEVILCPGNISPFQAQVPSVVMLQHMGPFCSSINRGTVGTSSWAWIRALGAMMRLSARTADRVIFISRYMRDLYAEQFGFPIDRSDVIYMGRDALKASSNYSVGLLKLGVRKPYILSVGHLQPYKNFPSLIEGFALAKAGFENPQTQLVLVGAPSSRRHENYLKELIAKHGAQDSILMTGGVPHQVVAELLDNCESFVFQSTCENCPSSLIEALYAGVPIACSNAGVMPEIAGDAALYFNPNDPQEISQVLTRICADSRLRDSLRNKSYAESKKFPTWDEVGQLTLDSLVRAAEGR